MAEGSHNMQNRITGHSIRMVEKHCPRYPYILVLQRSSNTCQLQASMSPKEITYDISTAEVHRTGPHS